MAAAASRTSQPATSEQQQQSPLPSSSSTRASPSRVVKQQEHDTASESSSVHSGETPERRDIDILAQVLSTRSEEYRLLFRLPPDEVLVQDFNCALQENILLQGHMYLFIHNVCFYSNIFGFETKKTISFNEIISVRKAKTAAIFPNAIEIVAGAKKHFFGSFLSRDEAYKLIVDGWAQHNSEVKAFLERQEMWAFFMCDVKRSSEKLIPHASCWSILLLRNRMIFIGKHGFIYVLFEACWKLLLDWGVHTSCTVK